MAQAKRRSTQVGMGKGGGTDGGPRDREFATSATEPHMAVPKQPPAPKSTGAQRRVTLDIAAISFPPEEPTGVKPKITKQPVSGERAKSNPPPEAQGKKQREALRVDEVPV